MDEFKRLTSMDERGEPDILCDAVGCFTCSDEGRCPVLPAAIKRLAAYEDTNLTPEQVVEMIKEKDSQSFFKKQGHWVLEVSHYVDDDGDAVVYTMAKCSNCGKEYREGKTVSSGYLQRPDELGEAWINDDEKYEERHKEWCKSIEMLKENVLEKSKGVKMLPYCSYCGAKMDEEEGVEKDG